MNPAPAFPIWFAPLAVVTAGAVTAFAFAPYSQWPLALLAPAALAYFCYGSSAARAALLAWCYGSGLMLAGASWIYVSIHEHGNAAPPLAASLTLLFCVGIGLFYAAFGWCFGRLFKTAQMLPAIAGFATLWILFEWVRGWLLTGFPWLYLGHALLDTPMAGWAPVTGVLGMSLIAVAIAASIAALLRQRDANLLTPAAVLLVAIGTGAAIDDVEWTRPEGERPLRIATVQPNIPQHLKWRRDQYWPTVQTFREMTAQIWADHDLLIWPEVAIPSTYQRSQDFLDSMGQLSAGKGATLISGILYRDGDRTHNSVMNLATGSRYDKRKLVPFGEYVPLESVLRGLIEFFNMPTSFITAGADRQPLIRVGELQIATAICYEIVYQDLVASAARDANLLLTVSNDAWFGTSAGPHQHFQIARLRARETGKPLIRATGTGISALIDHRGRVVADIPQFHQQTLSGELTARSGATPFARSGSWPVLVLCIGLLIAAARRPAAAG